MNRRGQVFENPVTGERAVILTDPDEQLERVLVVDLHVRPGGRVAAPHFHPTLTERFHVLSGRVGFLIGADQSELGPGGAAEVPPNTLHDWWQVGEDEARVMVEVDPGDRFLEMVGTMFGLARDGKVNKRGIPHPLQLAVTARGYRDVMVIASPPPWVQRLMLGALAPIGRLLGRRPAYAEYVASGPSAQVDPATVAMLTTEGRLRFNGRLERPSTRFRQPQAAQNCQYQRWSGARARPRSVRLPPGCDLRINGRRLLIRPQRDRPEQIMHGQGVVLVAK